MDEMKEGESREAPTPREAEFMDALEELIPLALEFDLWTDEDGTPWVMTYLGLLGGADGRTIMRTLRLDFDSAGIRGGWSPYNMNGDAGVRAAKAGVDTSPPQGIAMAADGSTPAELARAAAEWYQRRQEDWKKEREQASRDRRRR